MENSELVTTASATVPGADEMWSSSGFDCDCGSPPEFYLPPPPRPPFMSEYFCNENSINPEFESCDTLPIIDASYRSGPSIPMSAVFVLSSLILAFIICMSIIIVWKHKRKMRNFPSCKKSSQQQNCGGDVVGSTVQAPNVIYEDLNDVLQQQQRQQRQQRDRTGRRSSSIIATNNRFGYGSDYSSGHTKHSSMEMIDVKNIHYPSGYTMTMNTPIFLCSSPGPDPYCSQEIYNRIYEELSDAETELAHGSEDEFAEDELSLNNNNHSNTFANCNTLESKRLQKLQLLNHNCNCSFNLTNTLPATLKWTQTANTKDNQRCLQQHEQQQPLNDMTVATCGLYSVKRPHHHHQHQHPNPHPHHQYYHQQQQQQHQQQPQPPYCCMPINTISSGHCDFQNCTSGTSGPKHLNYRNQNEFHEGIIFDSFLQMYPNHINNPKNQKSNSNTNSTNRSSFGKKLKTTLTKSRKLRTNLSRAQVSQQEPQQQSSLPIAINKMMLSSPAVTTTTAFCCNNSTSSNCSSSNSSNTTMTATSATKTCSQPSCLPTNERHHHFENPYETVPVSYDQLLALHQHQQQHQQQQQQQHNRNTSKLPKLYSQDSAFGSDSGYSNNTTTTNVSAAAASSSAAAAAAAATTTALNRNDSKRFSLTMKNDELS